MTFTAFATRPSGTAAARLASKAGRLLMLAAILAVGSFFTMNPKITLVFLLLGGTFSGIALLSWLARFGAIREAQKLQAAVIGLVQKDAMACIMTDCRGAVRYMNDAATRRFTARLENNGASTLTALLRGLFANPAAVLFRMQENALHYGAAHEDMVTRRGHIRLNVHQVHDDRFLWRLEEMADRGVMRGEGAALPMLTVGRNNAILFMNDAARRFLGERAKTLDRVFPELPVICGRRNAISTTMGIKYCVVAEITGHIGKREIYLVPINEAQAFEPDNNGYLDDLPVALLKIAPDGALLLSNRLARNLLGIKTHEGMQLPALMEGLGRSITDWLREAAAGQLRHHSEVLRLTRQDREMFVQVTLNRVQQDGQAVLVAVLNDATELKTLEAQFVQGQKMQAIGQLAGGIAHDFNNLLTAISGHCDLLLLRHDQGDQDYPDLVQINQNANRAASLVGQLLAFSRKQTLQPEILDLRETLSDLTYLLNRLVGEKVRLSLSHQPELQAIRADKRQLEQVLMNLVVNARDAMPEGGEIRIETSCLNLKETIERDRATVAVGSYVVVKVRDEGVGIPADKLPKIF